MFILKPNNYFNPTIYYTIKRYVIFFLKNLSLFLILLLSPKLILYNLLSID